MHEHINNSLPSKQTLSPACLGVQLWLQHLHNHAGSRLQFNPLQPARLHKADTGVLAHVDDSLVQEVGWGLKICVKYGHKPGAPGEKKGGGGSAGGLT